MARAGISSHIPKSSTYPTSTYSSSYKPSTYLNRTYTSSFNKALPDYKSYSSSNTLLKTRSSSTSGRLRSPLSCTSTYQNSRSSLITPSLGSKQFGVATIDSSVRPDNFSTKTIQPFRTHQTHYGNGVSNYSSNYHTPSRVYDRSYGRFSQERTVPEVSKDLGELNLQQRLLPLRRSSSHFDLSSSRVSMERTSVGRGEAAEDKEDGDKRRLTHRVHPTMGIYAANSTAEKRLGGSWDDKADDAAIENGKVETNNTDNYIYSRGNQSGRKSPSVDHVNEDYESDRRKRYSSVDRYCASKSSGVIKSNRSARSCTGLRNIGNTCFMNSVLQCLAHTKPLLDYCLESKYEADINKEASRMKGVLIAVFAELMHSLWNGEETVVSPTKFKCEVARFAKLFLGYNQQDAQEFLLYLLQGLHEDVNRVREKKKRQINDSDEVETISASEKARKSWKEHLEFENSRIVDLFEGQLKSALTCMECRYVSNTFDPALGLSLPIKKSHGLSVSLLDCLELFTQEEVLDGNECTMCARCKRKQKSTKMLSIQKFPQILVINLKRFNDENSYRSKLSTDVKCPLKNLDLRKFASEKIAGSAIYELYAVSNHSGTPSGGHYTAAARNPYTGDWYYYNDHRVSPISDSEVVTSEAYILFYELSSRSLDN